MRLINQVMEMRKLDRGQVRLLTVPTDVDTFFRAIASSFDNIAEEKHIQFEIHVEPGLPTVWIDQENWTRWCSMSFPMRLNTPPRAGR